MSQAKRKSELLLSDDRYRLLLDAVIDYAIYMLDADGRVASWNAGARRFKGYEEEEILGQHFSRFYTEEDRAAGMPQRALDKAVIEGRFEGAGWRLRKNGERFWCHVVVDPIRNDKGILIGFAKITRDITDNLHAQQALEKARESLFQAQKMESLGRLTGGIAHDFNNLLMVVLGSLEVVRRRVPQDPKILNLLDNAIQGAQRGATLTQRMLAFSRSQKLVEELVDAPSLVRGMSEMLQRALGPQMRIETRFPLTLKPVMADSNQLEMALLNLVVNARDAMGDDGQIIISAREVKLANDEGSVPAGSYICLAVADNGEGMDAATLNSAREPFFTTKGVGKGTGLGLSMVHGFAEQSRGRLVLHSEIGKGTTAEIWLPVAQGQAVEAVSETPVFAVSAVVQALRVLVVDDDPLVLISTAAMLEDLGYTTLQAESASAALVILEAGKTVDVVITDLAMPDISGADLAREIKRRWPGLPVLLASGYADKLEDPGIELPHIGKPFNQSELVQALVELCQ